MKKSIFHIAELSGNHNNSLENTIDLIDVFHAAGASSIKFQTFTADTITIKSDRPEFKINGSLWNGRTLYDLYQESSMPWEWQIELAKKIKTLNMKFISSPFDYSAVDFLIEQNVDSLKVASPEIIDTPLIRYMAETGKPLIISTGMASMSEIDAALNAAFSGKTNKVTLLKCTSSYPSPLASMNLGAIKRLRDAFGVEVGLSDHSLGILVPIIAASIGVKVIEKHVILNRDTGGIDSDFSLEPAEYADMVKQTNQVLTALGDNIGQTKEESVAALHRRSLYAVKNIEQGEIFTSENVKSIRPGSGLKPDFYPLILNSVAAIDITAGEPLNLNMVVWDI